MHSRKMFALAGLVSMAMLAPGQWKPKDTEWDLELPEDQEEPRTAEQLEEDAADRDRREREIRDLQTLLLEVRLKQLLDLVRLGQFDEGQRENIIELMKKLAQMKARGRYRPTTASEE